MNGRHARPLPRRFQTYLLGSVLSRDEAGVKWTFCVGRSTLEALEPDQTIIPDLTFHQFRAQIYASATARMEAGSPEAQHVITLEDIQG
jgi:hypothetical protein